MSQPAQAVFLGFKLDPNFEIVTIFHMNSVTKSEIIRTINLQDDKDTFSKWTKQNIPTDWATMEKIRWYKILAQQQLQQEPLSLSVLFSGNISTLKGLGVLP